MKGKAEPMRLWRALRVVANRGGEGRSSGLEAPFVGRERELRLVKDLFQTSAETGRAHLALVTGSAGIGKSRLSWEFEKYVDGLTLDVWWHKGRCLSYGEGVAYWALAEMVRGRAGILENEDTPTAAAKIRASVAEHVPDATDREWVEPRLAHLLGLADATFEREDLFAAWRLFFECLADEAPTVLVFEDLQWADAGLLDFIEYLVEWARAKPIFVLGLARPELSERRPGFGTATRGGFTGLALEPLTDDAMDELLEGLVPGLPEKLRASIRARAEGIPLYAVETVRMLMNRGQVERANGAYHVVGEIEALEVPETLHALVASRIDGLDPDERRLVQDASVLGKTFVLDALASVSGRGTAEVEPLLDGLVRKEIMFLELDPRSAERGQYGFLQDLVRHVAYETLARRDRKVRHLAAASFFETSWGGRDQEVVEVVASHYLTALELEPDAADADTLRTKVIDGLTRAGDRAASLGAPAEALTWLARAAGLVDDPVEEARLRSRAGNSAVAAGDSDAAHEQLERAIALLEGQGDLHAAARASADLAQIEFNTGRLADALERVERAYEAIKDDEPDENLAFLLASTGRWQFFAGNYELAHERNDAALAIAERLRLVETLSHALNTAGLLADQRGRGETSLALIGHALELALEHDLSAAAMRAYINMSGPLVRLGNFAEAIHLTEKALELSRRIGNRNAEWFALGNLADFYFVSGRWDDVARIGGELPPGFEPVALGLNATLAELARHRGDAAAAQRVVDAIVSLETSASVQDRSVFASSRCSALMAQERHGAALELLDAFSANIESSLEAEWVLFAVAEAALALGQLERAEAAIAEAEAWDPGSTGPIIRAQVARFRGLLAAAQGDLVRAEESFKSAAAAWREYDVPFHLACTELEYAQLLAAQGRADEAVPLTAEAREIFERLHATPWLTRTDALASQLPAPAPALA